MNSPNRLLVVLLLLAPFSLPPQTAETSPPDRLVNANTIHRVISLRDNNELEVSCGSDDGCTKGMVLSVYSADGGKYLGNIEVVATSFDRSICRLLPDTPKGVIKKGDRVYPARD